MKQSKRPKRWQKECLSAHGLKVDDWRIVGETDMSLIIINKRELLCLYVYYWYCILHVVFLSLTGI